MGSSSRQAEDEQHTSKKTSKPKSSITDPGPNRGNQDATCFKEGEARRHSKMAGGGCGGASHWQQPRIGGGKRNASRGARTPSFEDDREGRAKYGLAQMPQTTVQKERKRYGLGEGKGGKIRRETTKGEGKRIPI